MLKNYIKIAYKVLMRRKFFTFVSLFGISFTLLVLIVATAILNYLAMPARPGSRLDRTLYIEMCELKNEKSHVYSFPSYYLLDRYARTMKTPEAIAIHTNTGTIYTYVRTQKLKLERKFTDEVFWDILEFDFIEGRPYDRDEVANAAQVAVIDDRTGKEVFGGEGAVGKYIETTEANYRVVGVFRHQDIPIHSAAAEIYVPITTSRAAMTHTQLYGNCMAYVLAAGKTDFDPIKAEFAGRLDDLLEDYKGEWDTFICNMGTQSDLLVKYVLGSDSEGESIIAVGVVILAMVLFMLFPAINLININLSRIFERSSEIGVRKAFGASSITLTGQFIVENIFLTLIGGAVAFIIALISLETISESGLLPFGNLSINLRVFFYSLIICLFFGLFSGALPAYLMSRLHPVQALRGVGL